MSSQVVKNKKNETITNQAFALTFKFLCDDNHWYFDIQDNCLEKLKYTRQECCH